MWEFVVVRWNSLWLWLWVGRLFVGFEGLLGEFVGRAGDEQVWVITEFSKGD
jgi:hypothetical protein